MGPNHTACLTDAGKVITFGRNSEAQLGRGHARSVAGPDVVKASSQLSSIKLSWQLQCNIYANTQNDIGRGAALRLVRSPLQWHGPFGMDGGTF